MSNPPTLTERTAARLADKEFRYICERGNAATTTTTMPPTNKLLILTGAGHTVIDNPADVDSTNAKDCQLVGPTPGHLRGATVGLLMEPDPTWVSCGGTTPYSSDPSDKCSMSSALTGQVVGAVELPYGISYSANVVVNDVMIITGNINNTKLPKYLLNKLI